MDVCTYIRMHLSSLVPRRLYLSRFGGGGGRGCGFPAGCSTLYATEWFEILNNRMVEWCEIFNSGDKCTCPSGLAELEQLYVESYIESSVHNVTAPHSSPGLF